MASGVVVTRSQFTQQLTGHSVNLLSITPCLALSPPLSPPLSSFFALFLQQISFVKSQKSYLLSAEDKVLQCSAGAALGRVVTEEKKEALQGSREMPRDAAEPAPHARTQPRPLSPLVRAAAAEANRKGRG